MIPKLKTAEHLRDHVIRLTWADGVTGEVDLAQELQGEVFALLHDVTYFRRFYVHPELHTLTWPNGADFAPEFLYEKTQITA